ncbi:MAG: recombinase family protein [Actinomycetota bacterium]
MVYAACVYARISSDPDGTRLGVERQIADCGALAAGLGWPVAEVYVDNDVSAWSGRNRPEYRRMLEDLKHGTRDAVLVWQLDRLHRHPRELEEFFDLVAAAGIAENLATVTGEHDLSTGEGRLMARIVGAVARKESDDKSLRLKRKHAELAAAGKVAGGGPRPFGYETDRITVNPSEAAIVREMAARVLAGDSLSSVAADLNTRGIGTTQGNEWNSGGIKRVLMSARISGRRDHLGEFSNAQWDQIVTPDDSDRLRRLLGARTQTSRRTPRDYLLTGGLLRCGRCDTPMISRPTAKKERRYVCDGGPGHSGCGRMSVVADPLEAFIAQAVLYRLDTPELAAALSDARAQQTEWADLQDQATADQERLDQLAADFGNEIIGRSEWLAAREPIQARIDENRRRLSRISPTTAIDEYAGNAETLRTIWDEITMPRRQAIVRVLIDHITANPAKPGRGFDPGRFEPTWRL